MRSTLSSPRLFRISVSKESTNVSAAGNACPQRRASSSRPLLGPSRDKTVPIAQPNTLALGFPQALSLLSSNCGGATSGILCLNDTNQSMRTLSSISRHLETSCRTQVPRSSTTSVGLLHSRLRLSVRSPNSTSGGGVGSSRSLSSRKNRDQKSVRSAMSSGEIAAKGNTATPHSR